MLHPLNLIGLFMVPYATLIQGIYRAELTDNLMSIERREIEKLATLSRIAINEETISEVSQRLGSVLELVDQLQAVDTDGVEAMSHPMQATQRLREDEVTELNRREALQAIAPETEDGLFLVPKVIE